MRNKSMVLALFLAFMTINCGQAAASFSQGSFVPCNTISVSNQTRQVYRIVRGDTLWEISRIYKVDLATLMTLNHINENTVLKIGQELVLPADSTRLHCIKPGESMWEIAASYDISLKELVGMNPDKNPDNLKIGTTLKLPDRAAYRIAQVEPSRSLSLPVGLLSWPTTGVITSRYGWRSSGYHHGLDIAAKAGTPIKACDGGKVSFAGYKTIYGRTVVIEHYDGKESVYAHAQNIYVKSGQKVTKGQVIATVGTTGNSTGPHLHFEIKQNGKTLDPAKYLQH